VEEVSGISAVRVLGRSMLEVFPSFSEEEDEELLRAALEGKRAARSNRPFRIAQTADIRFYDTFYAPLWNPQGQILGGVLFARDVTERRRTELELQASDARFRVMADSAPVMLWMSGTDSECFFFNQGWLRFTGRTLEEETGTGWAEGIHPEDFQHCMDIYLEAFNERRAFRMEYRLRRADGAYRWILDQGTPRHGQDGHFEGFIGSCIDVEDFKEAEQALARANDELELRVRQRTTELRQSNDDLEQFAYAASHDLQEPLRTVASYVQLLARRYEGKLDTDADDFIRYSVDGVVRMQALIRDLLAYSRLSTHKDQFRDVESEEIFAHVLANLHAAIEETGAEVTHDPLPRLHADASRLTSLFQNLIGNGIKFRGAEKPRVHVSAERRGADWVLSFRDNGIGIEANYADRIFVIFQRLHARERYPGTGIGLAICKKIVDQHGGRIWFESEPDRGTTFFVSLPSKP
jgi:PAS domain S-box-containing protein